MALLRDSGGPRMMYVGAFRVAGDVVTRRVLRQLAGDGVLRVDLDETLEGIAVADLGRCGFTRVGSMGRWEVDDAI